LLNLYWRAKIIKPNVIWDENKNAINIKKHGVDFNEAATVFNDPNIMILFDERHSEDEERFIALGYSRLTRLLTVCHCYRENDTVIRLITARKADKRERKDYEGGNKL